MEETNIQGPEGSGSPESGPEAEQYVFYNVMPKDKSSGKIISPKLAVVTPVETIPPQDSSSFFNQYKKIIFIVLAVLALAAVGYFVYIKFFSGNNGSVDSLTVPSQNKPKKETVPTSTAEFTTPQDWRDQAFEKGCTDVEVCGDKADPDKDGLINLEEYNLKTDPNNADCDHDGIADGDEVHIFGTDPLNAYSGQDKSYNDADNIKGGYNFRTGQKYTDEEIKDIKTKLDKYGVQIKTAETLGDSLKKIYHFGENPAPGTATSTPATTPTSTSSTTLSILSSVDMSPNAKQDRDTKRSDAIKAVGIALVKYETDHGELPDTNIFSDMISEVRPYIKVATNFIDPINKDPFQYAYAMSDDGKDFTLAYYSETQGMLIKKHSTDAQHDLDMQQADLRDDQRKRDLDSLRTALLLYSGNNAGPAQDFIFPSQTKYKSALLTSNYIGSIPKDPKTGQDYPYQVSSKLDTFTIKATLEDPGTGTTGWMCNQDDCNYY